MSAGVDAGDFGAWLVQMRAALRGAQGSAVPCGDCTGCCTSGYSLELRPHDQAALERVPAASLCRSSVGPSQWTVRPDPDGTCPMLHSGRCSIYVRRPQTCLDYDCRVFTAAGLLAGGDDKAVINRRVAQWRFRFSREEDSEAHAAIRAAATFLRQERALFPPGVVPHNPLGVAALALRVYPVFVPPGPSADKAATASAVLAARDSFDENVSERETA